MLDSRASPKSIEVLPCPIFGGGSNFVYDIGSIAHQIRHVPNPRSVQNALHLLSFEHDETASSEMSVNFYQITRHDIDRTIVL